MPRMEKSPLLANGYNHPPTHLTQMQFMQLGHPIAGHAILSSASLSQQLHSRAEQGLKVNPNIPMEVFARYVQPSFFTNFNTDFVLNDYFFKKWQKIKEKL